jgi:hypothetical protein
MQFFVHDNYSLRSMLLLYEDAPILQVNVCTFNLFLCTLLFF